MSDAVICTEHEEYDEECMTCRAQNLYDSCANLVIENADLKADVERLQTEYDRAVEEIMVLSESGDPLLVKGWTDILDTWKTMARERGDRLCTLKAVITTVRDFAVADLADGLDEDDMLDECWLRLEKIKKLMKESLETKVENGRKLAGRAEASDERIRCGACRFKEIREPGNEDGWCYIFRDRPDKLPCAQYDDLPGSPVAVVMRAARKKGGAALLRETPASPTQGGHQ